MAKLSAHDVLDTMPGANGEIWNVVNAIRNDDSYLRDNIPTANMDNVLAVGAGLLGNETVQNAFIGSLINRIAKVIIQRVSLTNPLAMFKKGPFRNGYTIEQIFVDICRAHKYNPDVAETEVFKREIPNVKVLFHQVNREDFYKQTISQDQLKQAFTSWDGVTSLVTGIINAMYNSNNVDEYAYMKSLFSNYASKNYFTMVKVPEPKDADSARSFLTTVKAYSNRLTFPSNQYNALGVTTQTDKSDQYLFMNSDIDALADVNVLAQAFNMSRAEFMGHQHLIDDLPGLPAGLSVAGILTDRDFFQVYDQTQEMTNQWNGEGLYWNYWYHVWQVMSVSRFSPAIIFVYGDDSVIPTVSSVIVSPTIANISKGRSLQYSALVKTTIKGTDTSVTWSVTGASSSDTKIATDGTLTVGADETAKQLTIVATTVAKNGTGDTAKAVTGYAYATVRD